jgi:AraC-like DNA-binding protein
VRQPEPWEPTRLPPFQGLLTPVLVNLFAELRVSVSLWATRDQWHPFHVESSVADFEYEQGLAAQRWAYDIRCFQKAAASRQIVVGEHAGFHDVFAPVYDGDEPNGILVAGPFATAPPSAAEVRARWHAISGSQAHVADPRFSRYLDATLGTLTLVGRQFHAFKRLMSCFADVLVARGTSSTLTARVEALRRDLAMARHVERVWMTAHAMVEGRTERFWDHYGQGTAVGLTLQPSHVIVGLLLGRPDDADPVEDALRRDAFQRACVDLSQEHGEAVCMPVGDHGVAVLVNATRQKGRARAKLIDLASRVADLGRRHHFQISCGLSQAEVPGPLRAAYDAALRAAEKALSRGENIAYGEPQLAPSFEQVRRLRRELAKSVGDRPTMLGPRFDRYVEAVLAHSGYRLETTRRNLESGLDRLVEPLLDGGFVDPRSLEELSASMDRAAAEARTVMDLAQSYRRFVADLEATMQKPTRARQQRGTRRAIEFVREHLGEPLRLARVAEAAGFGPDHFSEIFKREHGVTFAHYRQTARIDRAKQMLAGTKLSIDQIQTLTGFRNRAYFHRVFKTVVGTTPAGYRKAGGERFGIATRRGPPAKSGEGPGSRTRPQAGLSQAERGNPARR